MKNKVIAFIKLLDRSKQMATRTEILAQFPCNDHEGVHKVIEELKEVGVVYSDSVYNQNGRFEGIGHFIQKTKLEGE